jgi:hypothetical protein
MSTGNYGNNFGTIQEFWGSFSQCEQIISGFNLRIYRKFEENNLRRNLLNMDHRLTIITLHSLNKVKMLKWY